MPKNAVFLLKNRKNCPHTSGSWGLRRQTPIGLRWLGAPHLVKWVAITGVAIRFLIERVMWVFN